MKMGKLAFVFPSQGSQYVGMGKGMAEKFKSADNIFNQASEILGMDLKKAVFESEEESLNLTENTQPAIVAASIACLQPLLEEGIKPDVIAGLSLGEYTAHVAAGSIKFEDAIALVKKRGKYMQESVPVGLGCMGAIVGINKEQVLECVEFASEAGIVEPASYDGPKQIVIAGEIEAVEFALSLAKQIGARLTTKLPVSAPFHCSMLKPAGDKLRLDLDAIDIHDLNTPLISNATAEYIADKSDIKELLVNQVDHAVLWEDCVKKMIDDGVTTFVEIGPGRILSGTIRQINRKVKCLQVEDPKSLEKTLKELQKV